MNVIWINPADIVARGNRLYSDRACVRLRCIEPALYLRNNGHNVSSVNIFHWKKWANDPGFFTADTYIIGKAFIDITQLIQYLRKLGKKVIVDVCDNIYEPPEDGLKPIYKSILPLADTVIASSDALAKILIKRIGKKVHSIPDYVEGKKLSPVFDPVKDEIKLLWFGYPNNLNLLGEILPDLRKLSEDLPVTLAIVTNWADYHSNIFKSDNKLRIRQIDWSPQNIARELAACDLVIIPSSSSPSRVTKSANRVITGLYAGKYVVAYPLPAYLEFSPYISLGKDLIKGIKFSLNNPDIVRKRISDAQQYIDKFYSPRRISKLWESVLTNK